jgi:hypothetical protein
MSKTPLLSIAGAAALALSWSALGQPVPPPGSAEGMESGTYGSSVGFDVRGTGPTDRLGRPNDPSTLPDTSHKPITPKKTDETSPDDRRIGVPPGSRGPGSVPGASMNPGLTGGDARSVSPNLNPGIGMPGSGDSTGGAPAPQGGRR